MFLHGCEATSLSPEARRGLLVAAVIFASGLLVAAWMASMGRAPLVGAGVFAGATLIGGALLNRRAVVPGLPLLSAAIVAAVALGGEVTGSFSATTGGGALFVALMLATVARSRAAGLLATAILAASVILASWI